MTPVAWNSLILGDLSGLDDDQLDTARRTAECYGNTLAWGVGAIGQLLAVAAESGEMGNRAATDAGWLLENLGELSAILADVQRAAIHAQVQRKERTA